MNSPRIFPNYHTHTHYCDGKGSPEEYVKEAILLKMPALGFSGHAPVPFSSWWNMEQVDFEKYLQETKALKEKYKNEIDVFIGVEADFLPGLVTPKTFEHLNLDYIIGSLHFLYPEKAEAPWDFIISAGKFKKGLESYFDNDINSFLKYYYTKMNEMIELGGFDFIAHIDQANKYNKNNQFFNEDSPFFKKLIEETIELVAEKDVIVEINTRGRLKKLSEVFYPSRQFLEICKSRGVRICLSADAHRTVELQSFLPEAEQAALDAGYTEVYELTKSGWNARGI